MRYNRPISPAQAANRRNECPSCGEKICYEISGHPVPTELIPEDAGKTGRYFWGMMTIPIRHRVFFFKVTLVLHVEVCYCPNCGLFGIGVRVR